MSAYAKAVVAGLVAGLGSLAASLDDGHLSAQEIVTAVLVLLVAFGGVYGVPNKAGGQ